MSVNLNKEGTFEYVIPSPSTLIKTICIFRAWWWIIGTEMGRCLVSNAKEPVLVCMHVLCACKIKSARVNESHMCVKNKQTNKQNTSKAVDGLRWYSSWEVKGMNVQVIGWRPGVSLTTTKSISKLVSCWRWRSRGGERQAGDRTFPSYKSVAVSWSNKIKDLDSYRNGIHLHDMQ